MASHQAQLASAAATIAMTAAADALRRLKLQADPEMLAGALRLSVAGHLAQAIADAREALQLGMQDTATATFAASMRLAGIEAARQVGCPIARSA